MTKIISAGDSGCRKVARKSSLSRQQTPRCVYRAEQGAAQAQCARRRVPARLGLAVRQPASSAHFTSRPEPPLSDDQPAARARAIRHAWQASLRTPTSGAATETRVPRSFFSGRSFARTDVVYLLRNKVQCAIEREARG